MALISNNVSKDFLTKKYLLNFQTHLGSRKLFRNSDLDEYLYGFDNLSNSVFNVEKTLVSFKRALNFLSILYTNKKTILFIGTGAKSKKLVKILGVKLKQPYVQTRWIRGLLTNWENISSSIKFFRLFQKKLQLSKKSKIRLDQTFQGLASLNELPAAIFLFDSHINSEIIKEARRLNIPVIAIIDNRTSMLSHIDYPIFTNTDSVLSLSMITTLVLRFLK
jgi:small subunit ribosomal protein S2